MSLDLPEKLKGFSLFVDGRGYAGRVEELTLPKLTRKMEEYRAGGMNAPVEIDMGMEKLEADYTLGEYNPDILKLFGLTDPAGVTVKIKGSVLADAPSASEVPVEVVLRGRHREIDMGTWKGGDNATLKIMVAVTAYRLDRNNQTLIDIDIPAMKEIVGGTDRLAQRRANLGV